MSDIPTIEVASKNPILSSDIISEKELPNFVFQPVGELKDLQCMIYQAFLRKYKDFEKNDELRENTKILSAYKNAEYWLRESKITEFREGRIPNARNYGKFRSLLRIARLFSEHEVLLDSIYSNKIWKMNLDDYTNEDIEFLESIGSLYNNLLQNLFKITCLFSRLDKRTQTPPNPFQSLIQSPFQTNSSSKTIISNKFFNEKVDDK